MAWIWSDELAACARTAGIEDDRLEGWAHQPVAHWLPPGTLATDLARRQLGLDTAEHAPEPAGSPTTSVRLCDCAAVSTGEVLAPRAIAG